MENSKAKQFWFSALAIFFVTPCVLILLSITSPTIWSVVLAASAPATFNIQHAKTALTKRCLQLSSNMENILQRQSDDIVIKIHLLLSIAP